MNEQAQKILLDLIQKATSGIDSAVAFSQAQIPDVVAQMLMWKFTVSLMNTAISLVVLAATYFICLRLYRPVTKHIRNRELERINTALRLKWDAGEINCNQFYELRLDVTSTGNHPVFLAASVWTGVIGVFTSIALLDLDWLKIWLAPKFYLVEYAANLIKG